MLVKLTPSTYELLENFSQSTATEPEYYYFKLEVTKIN